MRSFKGGTICRETRQIAEKMNKTINDAAIFGEMADKKPIQFVEDESAV
ncbi:hypothetical protein [Oscillibacter sp. GMB15532]